MGSKCWEILKFSKNACKHLLANLFYKNIAWEYVYACIHATKLTA